MQLQINSANIGTFIVKVSFDILNRRVIWDTSSTTYNGSGASLVKGISFSLIDQSGVTLEAINFTAPQIQGPITSGNWIYTSDLSSVDFAFLFQTYQIIAAIQDSDNTIYQTAPVYKSLCQPQNITDSGYVPGIFQIIPDCINSVITVKEVTLLVYNNEQPISVSKSGNLYYPTGTIAPVAFANTPFSNNVVYTGQYSIQCTTVGTYSLGDDVYVLVSYVTNNVFPVTCKNKISDLMCCILEVQRTAIRHCEDAQGENARHQLYEILPYVVTGIGKEISGQDATFEADYIRKYLNCNCGSASQQQSEFTPINPAVDSIVLNGMGGTSVPSPTITGNTKTYNIASKIYQVVKGNTGDLAFTITVNNAIPNTVQYLLTINYDVFAGSILDAIAADPSLINQLNSLVNTLGFSAQGLNGLCIIDLTKANYSLSLTVNSSTVITNVVISGNTYNAPTNLFANNAVAVASWLNSLSLGSFTVTFSGNITSILSVGNSNVLSTMTFTTPNATLQFQATTATLNQILQAIFNYVCAQTALQVALGNALSLCSFDYSGIPFTTNYTSGQSQGAFNAGISSSICAIVSRMASLTGVTCSKIQACFSDSTAAFNNSTDRYLSIVGGSCVTLSAQQQALAFINAVNSYPIVKSAFCAIDCSVPGTCPDITGLNLSATNQTTIGFYGVTWNSTPSANQIVTVRFRVSGTTSWMTASSNVNLFPNGNINGSSPFQIGGLTSGTTYDVWVTNNCGGNGFTSQVTTPSVPVFSGSFLLDTIIYNICGDSPQTLYSSSAFGTGVTMYTNPGLTTPAIGFNFIANSSGNIYVINSSTGVVGSNTGSTCGSGTPGTYILGNAIPGVCSNIPATYYTNGSFATGLTLYSDSALTDPVTGFIYVVNTITNHIFNLNSSTGQIGSDTGTLCSGTANLTFSFINAGGGSFLSFAASLSRAIDANVNINLIASNGFTSGGCGGGSVSSAVNNTTWSILAGSTGNSISPNSTSGSWASASHYSVFDVTVNGVSRSNGDVVTIGSFSVTIVIPSCV